MKKSQVSIEFMFFVGMAFVLLAAYLVITYNYLDLTFKRSDIVNSLDLLEQLRNEINLASRLENGYTRIFVLPSKINKKDYTLSLNNREINIKFNNVDYARLLSTKVNVDKKTTGELFFSPGDIIFITKVNNQVYIDKTCSSGEICSFAYPNQNCQGNSCILECENSVWIYSQPDCSVGMYCNQNTQNCEIIS